MSILSSDILFFLLVIGIFLCRDHHTIFLLLIILSNKSEPIHLNFQISLFTLFINKFGAISCCKGQVNDKKIQHQAISNLATILTSHVQGNKGETEAIAMEEGKAKA